MTLPPGTSGVLFELHEESPWAHEARADDWEIRFAPGGRLVSAVTDRPVSRDRLVADAYETILMVCDRLSVDRGGHFRIADRWHGRLAWWAADHGTRAELSLDLVIRIPFGILQEDRRSPGDPAPSPPAGKRGTHSGFRHFRRAQLAEDVFAAFINMYLAFEALLHDHDPRRRQPNGRWEPEAIWLKRALGKAIASYGSMARESLARVGHVEEFMQQVYEAIRCNLFHAKGTPGALQAAVPEDEERVEAALQVLTEHVLELARPWTGWRLNARPLMEHHLLSTGEARFTQADVRLMGETASSDWSVTERLPDHPISRKGFPVYRAAFSKAVLKDIRSVKAVEVRLDQSVPVSIPLVALTPLDDIEELGVSVAIRPHMTQVVRTVYVRNA